MLLCTCEYSCVPEWILYPLSSDVMRDVTRLLYLVNKKPSAVQMPPDGLQLLNWSEQILQRYQASQGMVSTAPQTTNRLSVLGDQGETHF